MSLDLQSLIEKLNPVCKRGLETAARLCVSQSQYNVEIEHLLISLLDLPDTDIRKAFSFYNIKTGDVNHELLRAIEQFKRGNSRTPALSPQLIRLLEQAWLYSSIHLDTPSIRTGSLLLALLDDSDLRSLIIRSSLSLKRIPTASLKQKMSEITSTSFEDSGEFDEFSRLPDDTGKNPEKASRTPALDRFTIDITERARKNLIDPVKERDNEIRLIMDILTRRRQNNPILVGDAGVGKTAVVEGLAIRIQKNDVPDSLKNISLRLLDLGLLQAGAGIKGEFEKRLKTVIDEARTSLRPVILFIDEAHTLIGAGAPPGTGDAANLLKPALSRGELRTIAATTWAEYKKYFEKDPALARRFQVVSVKEPNQASAVVMLRGICANLEKHHKVRILDEAVVSAVKLSGRYITGRRLPDKAVSVLDTACARVALAHTAVPSVIENLTKKADEIKLEMKFLKREALSGENHKEKIDALTDELKKTAKKKEILEKRFLKEKRLVQRIVELNRDIEKHSESLDSKPAYLSRLKKELMEKKEKLAKIQAKEALIPIHVDSSVVAAVISDWTGIPVGKMLTDDIKIILSLDKEMKKSIIGQDMAVDAICKRIKTYKANMDDPGKPVGVFLLCGPSGVGKTRTAITLSRLLYGGEANMICLNMSEYQEAYTVSGLKGSPPGYTGHGKGGILTESVRKKPYSLVLLDEIEKAHTDVIELFYQIFDKGYMEDSDGLFVDFTNTLIILTTNAGSDIIIKACKNFSDPPDRQTLSELIRPALLEHFKPSFLGRLVVVPYYPLDNEVTEKIIKLKLAEIRERFYENHKIELNYSDNLVEAIAKRCTESETGARNVDNILTHFILPELSGEILRRMAQDEICYSIRIFIDDSGEFSYEFDPPSSLKKLPADSSGFKGFFPKHLFRLSSESIENFSKTGENEDEKKDIPVKTKKKKSILRDLFNRL